MNSAALKDRIKVVASEKGITFNEAWKQMLLERFLARLSQSNHHDKFIFKGGLLLAQYLVIGRETTDADFLMTKIKNETAAIEIAIKSIVTEEISDGFSFLWSGIEELKQPHMEYGGFRVSLNATFEKMKDKIQIDIGVGDHVNPREENFHPFEYKGRPIFAGEISLLVYPVETIFAEKLETLVSKGEVNSRMKDYHDIILMIRDPNLLDIKKLKGSVATTFESRGTTLRIPIEFEEAGMASLQQLWTRHLAGLGRYREQLKLPEQIREVLAEMNRWLTKNVGDI